MKVYCFDVDETLTCSAGPITRDMLYDLRTEHTIGICGNFAKATHEWSDWAEIFSFIGPMLMSKEQFLDQLKRYVPCEEVVMVGNIYGVTGRSDDKGAAARASVRFISEKDFANGSR